MKTSASSGAPNKRPDLSTEEGRDALRPTLDALEAVFIAAVAKGRGTTEATVRADFGKGGTAYNRYLGDADHQPNPCLGPLRRGPFYAVAVYAGDIGTAVGIYSGRLSKRLAPNAGA